MKTQHATYEQAYGVKIILHHAETRSANNEVIYWNEGFTFAQIRKWDWYFRYLTALAQVRNKKFYVEQSIYSYKMSLSSEETARRVKNKEAARKREITKWQNRLAAYEKSYNSLFSIDTDETYQILLNRLNQAKSKR